MSEQNVLDRPFCVVFAAMSRCLVVDALLNGGATQTCATLCPLATNGNTSHTHVHTHTHTHMCTHTLYYTLFWLHCSLYCSNACWCRGGASWDSDPIAVTMQIFCFILSNHTVTMTAVTRQVSIRLGQLLHASNGTVDGWDNIIP